MESRLAVIGIIVERPEHSAQAVQDILTRYSSIIVGRMGIPYRSRGVSVIALIVDGTTDAIGALSGQLGSLQGVRIRTAVTSAPSEGRAGACGGHSMPS
ncbi:MAG TPA: TM1266 family iron-only hydrogenase system putative regulator [Bacillota bacterium]|nr:TM1266 family iron-only hydrogenase system putative regulator [Bacillota bacterium]